MSLSRVLWNRDLDLIIIISVMMVKVVFVVSAMKNWGSFIGYPIVHVILTQVLVVRAQTKLSLRMRGAGP